MPVCGQKLQQIVTSLILTRLNSEHNGTFPTVGSLKSKLCDMYGPQNQRGINCEKLS
jgi:hypothetical protein